MKRKPDGRAACTGCGFRFHYYLVHNGFNESAHAYCEACGRTALLDGWTMPPTLGTRMHRGIRPEDEPDLEPCVCGGRYRAAACPRCPTCGLEIDAAVASNWLEADVASHQPEWCWLRVLRRTTQQRLAWLWRRPSSWRWQGTWDGLYCIVINDRLTRDPWIQAAKPLTPSAVPTGSPPVPPRLGTWGSRLGRSVVVAVGILAGVAVAMLTVFLGGAGHGWSSQTPSAVALLAAPLTCLAWTARQRTWARPLAAVLLMAGVATDIVIAISTQSEGWHYVTRAWHSAPAIFALWAVLWGGWQVFAAFVLWRQPRRG